MVFDLTEKKKNRKNTAWRFERLHLLGATYVLIFRQWIIHSFQSSFVFICRCYMHFSTKFTNSTYKTHPFQTILITEQVT